MSADELLDSPAWYAISVLVLSVALTFAMYAAFPIIFANARTKVITDLKYKRLCIGVTFVVAILYSIISGSVTRGAPAVLWGIVGYKIGVRTLKKKNLLVPADGETPPQQEEALKKTEGEEQQ